MSKLFNEILQSTGHHAHLIVGSRANHFEMIHGLMHDHVSAGTFQSPDMWTRVYETLSIDDARELKEVQNTKPNGERRIVLVSIGMIQHEAQNSLLKLFEEPSSQTTFFVCVESAEIFLPTLLSRFNIINPVHSAVDSSLKKTFSKTNEKEKLSIEDFVATSVQGRFSLVEPIIAEKNKEQAIGFLNNLEMYLSGNEGGEHAKPDGMLAAAHATVPARVFEQIFEARRFLRGRSPSVKMILEHISLITPRS